jgi:hypothetical protein
MAGPSLEVASSEIYAEKVLQAIDSAGGVADFHSKKKLRRGKLIASQLDQLHSWGAKASVPHPFAGILAKGWETSNLKLAPIHYDALSVSTSASNSGATLPPLTTATALR